MLVKICNLEPANDVVTVLPVGHHVVGRGPDFKCQDKRVSRMHATIEIGKNEATFTSVHINPCFFVSANSKTVTILKQDSSRPLESGDKFGFLPDKYWFRVEFVHGIDTMTVESKLNILSGFRDSEVADSPQTSQETIVNKRPQSSCEEHDSKRMKLDTNNAGPSNIAANIQSEDETITKEDSCERDQDSDIPVKSVNQNEQGIDTDKTKDFDSGLIEVTTSVNNDSNSEEVKIEPPNADNFSSASAIDEEGKNEGNCASTSVEQELNKEDADTENAATNDTKTPPNDNNPSTSDNNQSSSRRERCWYGAGCYRKNPLHRSDFSHPGDRDYDSDPNDNRPTCIFGATCYRKNKLHRRDYKHPSGPAPNKIRKRRAAAKKKVNDMGETPEDDYDLDDPFINDGDNSDEYQEESDSGDTDWEDSQNLEEDSEDMLRLLREAKRFVKKQK